VRWVGHRLPSYRNWLAKLLSLLLELQR
jgi:hypothetical protein